MAVRQTTLETIGLLLPFLSIPSSLQGRDIILRVDNKAVVYGWEDKGVNNDMTASILGDCA